MSSAAAPALVPDDQRTYLFNRASWGAIIAGVVAALVAQLLINLLGIGVGRRAHRSLLLGVRIPAMSAACSDAMSAGDSG
jgi:uncharacterized membrane protein YeaQ/YmgE (transglycosylase-associated protein family)